jgi:hypothetical protein
MFGKAMTETQQFAEVNVSVNEAYSSFLDLSRSMIPMLYSQGSNVSVTNTVLTDALTNPFPASRYYAGMDAIVGSTIRKVLPDYLWDQMVMGVFCGMKWLSAVRSRDLDQMRRQIITPKPTMKMQ